MHPVRRESRSAQKQKNGHPPILCALLPAFPGTKYPPACFTRSIKEQPAMASDKNLQELFHETLKDIYFGEKNP